MGVKRVRVYGSGYYRIRSFSHREIERDLAANRQDWFYAMKYGWTIKRTYKQPTHLGKFITQELNYHGPEDIRFTLCRITVELAAALILDGLSIGFESLYQLCDRRVRHLRRPKYYAAENARRRKFRRARRAIYRRTTFAPCPTAKALLDAWHHRKDSPAAVLRFGALLEDLECYCDNSLRFDENHQQITGRNGGIKQWFLENATELYDHYKNVMRYKALAKKLKQAAHISDPYSLGENLDIAEKSAPKETSNYLNQLKPNKPIQVSVIERALRYSARTFRPNNSFHAVEAVVEFLLASRIRHDIRQLAKSKIVNRKC